MRRRLRMPVLVAILSLAIGAGLAQASEDEGKNKAPRGGLRGEVVRFLAETAVEVWETLRPSDETEDEGTPKQEVGSENDPIAQFFGIPKNEYSRWPERWQQALRQVHASPEKFRRPTIHTLRMMHASDWDLVERLAPYAVERQLFVEKAGKEVFSGEGIEVGDLLDLEVLGIVTGANGSISSTLKPRSQNELYQAYRVGDYGLVLWFRDKDHTVEWKMTPITRPGRELLDLLGVKPNKEYLHRLGKVFAKLGIRTELWEVIHIPEKKQFTLDKQIWVVAPN